MNDFWDDRYGKPGFAYGRDPNDFLKEEAHRIRSGGSVLCIAEGQGRNAIYLAQAGYRVTAMDQSAVGLEKASKLASERGVEIKTVVADLSDYDFGNAQWDAVVSIWAHVPADLRMMLHKRIGKALCPGGTLILESYIERQLNMSGIGGPTEEMHDRFMSASGLKAELAGLEFPILREVEREIDEGPYHQGLSATVQLVARKPISDQP